MASFFPAVSSSKKAKRTTNPIRNITDNLRPDPNHTKSFLNLALGDPTIHGPHLQCPEVLHRAVVDVLASNTCNGYLPSFGSSPARKAIAQYSSREGSVVDEDDVILASGCSGALELAISVLVDEGDNILVPRPGFPLYEVITNSLGGEVRHYPLKADSDWECDLEAMDALVDSRTKAILINNPSNPCGSNFSLEHLRDIVAVARKHSLPIIADEIYCGLVFNGVFSPVQLVCEEVPVLSVGGIAKEFVVPGWRVGWVVVHDRGDCFREIRAGLKSLTQLILGATSIVQGALSRVLTPTPGSADADSLKAFEEKYIALLRNNARLCMELLRDCPLVSLIEPRGAMYVMFRINFDLLDTTLTDDAVFSQRLLAEENLILLPGQCFGMHGYVRVVTCPPAEVLTEALGRLVDFANRHRRS